MSRADGYSFLSGSREKQLSFRYKKFMYNNNSSQLSTCIRHYTKIEFLPSICRNPHFIKYFFQGCFHGVKYFCNTLLGLAYWFCKNFAPKDAVLLLQAEWPLWPQSLLRLGLRNHTSPILTRGQKNIPWASVWVHSWLTEKWTKSHRVRALFGFCFSNFANTFPYLRPQWSDFFFDPAECSPN